MPEQPDNQSPSATICDVTITYLEPSERSYPKDAYRVEQADGKAWLCTRSDLSQFSLELAELISQTWRKAAG